MTSPDDSVPARRVLVLACALAAGLLFAFLFGYGVSGSGGVRSGEPGANAVAGVTFAPAEVTFFLVPAVLGFLLGAVLGGGAGFLAGRRGFGGVVGFALVTLACGLAGLAAAGVFGAETRVAVVGNGVEVAYGARPAVLIVGAALGLVLGALLAWRVRPARGLATLVRPSL